MTIHDAVGVFVVYCRPVGTGDGSGDAIVQAGRAGVGVSGVVARLPEQSIVPVARITRVDQPIAIGIRLTLVGDAVGVAVFAAA